MQSHKPDGMSRKILLEHRYYPGLQTLRGYAAVMSEGAIGQALGSLEILVPMMGSTTNVATYLQNLLEALASTVLVCSVAVSSQGWRALDNQPALLLGKVSYSLYIIHFPVLIVIIAISAQLWNGLWASYIWVAPFITFLLVFTLSMLFALGLYRTIEKNTILLWHIPNHTFLIFHGGIAVIIFFIISGFYMSLVINEKYSVSSEENWMAKFYSNRILKLMPIYIVFCLIELAWYFKTNNPTVFTHDLGLKIQSHIALIFMNLFIIGQDLWQTILTQQSYQPNIPPIIGNIVNFFGDNAFNQNYLLVGQAWSLSTEILFYLIAPFIVRSRRKIAILAICSLLIRMFFVINAQIFSIPAWCMRFFPSTLLFFLLGSISYQIYKLINNRMSVRKNNFIGWSLVVVITVFVLHNLIINKGIFIHNISENYDTLEEWLFYILITITIPFLFNLSKKSKFDRLIGELSYPMYIVHGLVIGILINSTSYKTSIQEILILCLTILFSIALVYGIEKPIDKRFRKINVKAIN